ncbi:hypothetical protein SALBM217S_09134 [Streptomyces griseoloalbus]
MRRPRTGSGRQPLRLHTLTGSDAREDSAEGVLVLEGRTGETATAAGVRAWAARPGSLPRRPGLARRRQRRRGGKHRGGPDLLESSGRTELLRRDHGRSDRPRSPSWPRRVAARARTGVWCATKPTDAGGPINRAGNPMMWPIFWPDDTDSSDPASTRHPSEDVAAFGGTIADRVAKWSRPPAPRPTRRATDEPSPDNSSRRPALRDRHPRVLRLRHSQRPHPRGQCARGDDVWSPTWPYPVASPRRPPRRSGPTSSLVVPE